MPEYLDILSKWNAMLLLSSLKQALKKNNVDSTLKPLIKKKKKAAAAAISSCTLL